MRLVRVFALALVAWIGFATAPARGQTEFAPEFRDRPPVAAPTDRISVGAIPLVLAESEKVEIFVDGLIQGLMAGKRIDGVALAVVKDDRLMFQRGFGALAAETPFPAGALLSVFESVAVMQAVERMNLALTSDIGTLLGETNERGVTLAQVLAHQGDQELLARVVEKNMGATLNDTIVKGIATPLRMVATRVRDGRLTTTISDMSHLAIALANGGAFGDGRILAAESVDRMLRTEITPHPALPGWAFGLAEMQRNSWRALQRDGSVENHAARMVIVPQARIAYVVLAAGDTDDVFWRTLDDGLFDSLLPPRTAGLAAPSATPAPSAAAARAVAGAYEPLRDGAFSLAVLKRGARLRVESSDDNLILSGVENETLTPRPGGYWATGDGNLTAGVADGRLILSTGAYRPLALYKRPLTYALLALVVALAAAGWIVFERRRSPGRKVRSEIAFGAASAAAAFLLISVFVWLFSPVV